MTEPLRPAPGPTYWAALAPADYAEEFARELAFRALKPARQEGSFYLFTGARVPLGWASVVWREVEIVSFASIAAGARALKPRARLWRHVSTRQHRRGTLLLEQLRAAREPAPLEFPARFEPPEGLGAFTLLGPGELAWSRHFDRPDPAGALPFAEDKRAPSRAYLKLMEACTLLGAYPRAGERVVDLGACPGGWTYVAAELGAEVLAIDRAPLDPAVAGRPNVEVRAGDAFRETPERLGAVDWLLSDVICYPEKLFPFVEAWVRSGKAKRMVITIKFQGPPDPAAIAKFQELGRVLHLAHNKHELTFLYLGAHSVPHELAELK